MEGGAAGLIKKEWSGSLMIPSTCFMEWLAGERGHLLPRLFRIRDLERGLAQSSFGSVSHWCCFPLLCSSPAERQRWFAFKIPFFPASAGSAGEMFP